MIAIHLAIQVVNIVKVVNALPIAVSVLLVNNAIQQIRLLRARAHVYNVNPARIKHNGVLTRHVLPI